MNIMDFFTPKASTFYLDSDSTIRQALEKFDAHKFTVVPLLSEEGDFVSTVSVGDILCYIKNNADFDIAKAESVRLRDLSNYRPYSACKLSVSDEELIRLALEQNFVPLVDDRGKYMGIIKRKAILTYLLDRVKEKEEVLS